MCGRAQPAVSADLPETYLLVASDQTDDHNICKIECAALTTERACHSYRTQRVANKLTILSTLTTVNRVDLDLGILRVDGRSNQDDLAVVRRND
jgi:hypothetical protein